MENDNKFFQSIYQMTGLVIGLYISFLGDASLIETFVISIFASYVWFPIIILEIVSKML